MQYSLLRSAFPNFHVREKLEDTPTPQTTTTTVPPLPSPPAVPIKLEPDEVTYSPVYSTPQPPRPDVNLHIATVNHILECIKCRDHVMARMSFADKNRELVDMIPYLVVVIVMIVLYKKL